MLREFSFWYTSVSHYFCFSMMGSSQVRSSAIELGREPIPSLPASRGPSWPSRSSTMSHNWAPWCPRSSNGQRTHQIPARGKWRWGGWFIHPFFIIITCLCSWMSTLACRVSFVSIRSGLNGFSDQMLCQCIGRWLWCVQRWTLPRPASNVLMFIFAYFRLQECFIHL